MLLPAVPVGTVALPLPSPGEIYPVPVVMNEAFMPIDDGSKVADAAKQIHDGCTG